MISSDVRVGQTFRWQQSGTAKSGMAVVKNVLNDREEGMSPEVEQYVALWIEATGIAGDKKDENFTVLLGTDGRTSIEGEPVTVCVYP